MNEIKHLSFFNFTDINVMFEILHIIFGWIQIDWSWSESLMKHTVFAIWVSKILSDDINWAGDENRSGVYSVCA